jgi:signal peptidase II
MDSEAAPTPKGEPDAITTHAPAAADPAASPAGEILAPLPPEAPSTNGAGGDLAGPASASPLRAPSRTPSIAFLVVVTVTSLAADLVTKWWAKKHLAGFDPSHKTARRITVIEDHVDFIFAQNPGGAWSFLRGLPDTLRRPFFLVVSVAAVVFIISIYQRIYPEQRAMKWGLPLALGGAMGNLVDRIRYGWVVDFIDVYLVRGAREHHWPTFNVADIAIVIGVGLMSIDMLFLNGQRSRAGVVKHEPPSAALPPA